MENEHWKISDLPWARLDPAAVTPDLLAIIKAAALVEYNASAYADYLCRVFHDDADFQRDARRWAVEEIQHGQALGAWAQRIDPVWNFEGAMARFRAGYSPEHFLSVNDNSSVRGSRAGEMIARCMVEVGTSSYYSAVGDSVDEPVLKEICRHIASDEFRHYKLFYDTLNKYLTHEKMNVLRRVRVALSRIAESEDDELAYAYFAANAGPEETYNRARHSAAYMGRAYGFYRPKHADRAVAMIFKACGLKPHTVPYKIASRFAWRKIQGEHNRLKKLAA